MPTGDYIDAGTTDDEGPLNCRAMTQVLDSALKIADDSLRIFDDDEEEVEEKEEKAQ